jgi:hypothetical protein
MKKKYHMVNWVDGMKIRKQHFIDQQNAFSQHVMQGVSAQLNAVNFGLAAPSLQHEEPYYKLNVEVENTDTIYVKVFSCRATTPGGFLIHIGAESGQPREFIIPIPEEAKEGEGERRYKLVLSASPFNPREVGEPDPEETPPRRPYVEASYQLGLLPLQAGEAEKHDGGSLDLPIGEVTVNASGVHLNEDYIPPSMAVYSSPQLIEAHMQFYHSLRKLETLCVRIIRKIVNKKQEYLLALIVQQLSEDILSYLGTMLYRFNGELRYAPPIRMVEHIASLGRLMRNSIDIHQGSGKEELINYFVEWCKINQGQFEKVISQVVDHAYDHTAISEAIGCSTRFLDEITDLYIKLDELDYIGRKAEKDIFVKEEKRQPKPKKKGRINFLAQ